MKLSIKTSNFYLTYLTCFNGILKLTPKELKIASRLFYYKSRIGEAEPFSKDIKSKVMNDLSLDRYTFNNYIGSLKGKNIIVDRGEGNLVLNPRLYVPPVSQTLEFAITSE